MSKVSAIDTLPVEPEAPVINTTVIADNAFVVTDNANLSNDAYATATVSGNIEVNGNSDRYSFTVAAGETFILDIDHNRQSGEKMIQH